MSVERRGRRYYVRWREGGKSRAKSFTRWEDARNFDTDRRRAAELGAFASSTPSRLTLGTWLTEWEGLFSGQWAASTRTHRRDAVKRWIRPHLGHVPMRELGTRRVRGWRAAIVKAGATPATANHALRVLNTACGAAVRDGVLPLNPCSGIEKLPVVASQDSRVALTPATIEAIRAAMPSERDRVAVSLMGYAGLRPSELVGLRWQDVGDQLLHVSQAYSYGELRAGKTASAIRTVELIPPLAADLAAYRPARPEPGALVIPNERGGYVDWHVWRRRVWRPACKRARLDPVPTPYSLRHSYGSLLIHEGRSVAYVAASMGHASGVTTLDHYSHAFATARLETAVSLSDAVLGARRGVYETCTPATVKRLRQSAPSA